MRKQRYELSSIGWTLTGYYPFEWHLGRTVESGVDLKGETGPIPAKVPGSVQESLRRAGLLPDWNIGLNARLCEWVENRHWVYSAQIPEEWVEKRNATFRLRFEGLDQRGSVFIDRSEILRFSNAYIPYSVDITQNIRAGGRTIRLVFECSPRWLGQFGYTSQIREWKPRYNYKWDWTEQLVQIGIWDQVYFERVEDGEIVDICASPSVDIAAKTGRINVTGEVTAQGDRRVRVELRKLTGAMLAKKTAFVSDINESGISFEDFDIDLWWPHTLGKQPLYVVDVILEDADGRQLDSIQRKIAFRHVEWVPAEGAPEGADPWICRINGRELFLQGANWTPVRPNYADVEEGAYRKRIDVYRDIGVNMLRIWGGGFPEREWLFDLCDESGILVWLEFPLSSSGVENYPPDDSRSIRELSEIARSYIVRRRHHPSLILWCGGNELSGNKGRPPVPVSPTHPLIRTFASIVREMDPDRRFLPSSPSGPSSGAHEENFGKGIHWDVHGPWKAQGRLNEDWQRYWENDDSLFRGEAGAPGPSPVDVIRRYSGDCEPFPCSLANPLWRRTSWWIEWDQFIAETGREPGSLEEYVEWGQRRQAQALQHAAECCKNRFPRCGGFIVWMGHDSFPCTANTAIIDFEGNPKPSAPALKKIFKSKKAIRI